MGDPILDLRQALGFDMGTQGDEIKKAYAASLGNVGMLLEPAVKIMLPLANPLRVRLPVDRPAGGADKVTWRALLGYSDNDAAFFGAAFGATGPDLAYNAVSFSATYQALAVKSSAQWEAISFARGFDDAMATATQASLVRLLRGEEQVTLGGNQAAISAPGTITAVDSATGGSLSAATAYYFAVSALTYQGWQALANGHGTADSAGETVGTTANHTTGAGITAIDLSWAAIPGAVAYNVFAGTAANALHYVNTITVNKTTVKTIPATGNPANTADQSANTNVPEGVIAWCEKSTIYGNAITKTDFFIDQANAALTANYGNIKEFDTILANTWKDWQISPTLIICSPQGLIHFTKQVLGQTGAYQWRIDATDRQGKVTGGLIMTSYPNKFAATVAGQPPVIDVMAHPYMPDGTFLFLCEQVPYPFAREGRGFALDVNTPYTYFPLARTDRSFPFSVFLDQTLKCYLPAPQAAIVCVNVS